MSSDGRKKENKPKRDIMTSDGAYTRKDRRDNRMSSSGDLAKLEPPGWLDDPGLRIWEKFADLVYRAGVSTEMDYFSFEAMVLNYRELRKLQRDVALNGYTDDYTGKARPEVSAMHTTLKVHLETLKTYGMNPKARGVVAVPVGEMEKRAKPGDELKAEGFGKFTVTEGGGEINKPDLRRNDRTRRSGS